MPSWDDDDQLVEDPQQHVSLIYYPNRDGLEDRVFRIKTERSGASTPEPRTSHNISNIEIVEERDGEIDLRFNWHTLSHRYKKTDSFFGRRVLHARHERRRTADRCEESRSQERLHPPSDRHLPHLSGSPG